MGVGLWWEGVRPEEGAGGCEEGCRGVKLGPRGRAPGERLN